MLKYYLIALILHIKITEMLEIYLIFKIMNIKLNKFIEFFHRLLIKKL